MDLSSKAVFFNTKWFLSLSWDHSGNYRNSSLYFGCEDKALMSSEPSHDLNSRAKWPGEEYDIRLLVPHDMPVTCVSEW